MKFTKNGGLLSDICTLSSPSPKLLERTVRSNIMVHLWQHKLLSDRQLAFKRGEGGGEAEAVKFSELQIIRTELKSRIEVDKLTYSSWTRKKVFDTLH